MEDCYGTNQDCRFGNHKEEQLSIAKLLVKAGCTVSIRKGKVVNGKGTAFINYEMEEDKENGRI